MARILFVSTSTTLGGAEKTLYSLATLLDPKRHPLAGVVSLKPEGEYARRLRAQGAHVQSLGLTRAPGLADARRLARLIELARPDVVHALMYQAIQLGRVAKSLSSAPFKLVSSPRVNYRSRSWPTLLVDRALKGRDDLLIAECEASRDFLIRKLGYAPSKVVVIRNGVDVAGWPMSKVDRQNRRLELRLSSADLLIGAVGRLDRQKGFATLIRAMAQLKDLPVKCAILGEGPERPRLEALVRQHALEKTVWLIGEKTEIPSWLCAFDLYALPSLWEGLPNALLEAMALGLPVVASDVDGVPEAVADGKDGMLVAPDRPAALARALRALAVDPARRAALGRAAQATVAERFTLRRMLGEYEKAYDAALAL